VRFCRIRAENKKMGEGDTKKIVKEGHEREIKHTTGRTTTRKTSLPVGVFAFYVRQPWITI
jgi:hypothetical protein